MFKFLDKFMDDLESPYWPIYGMILTFAFIKLTPPVSWILLLSKYVVPEIFTKSRFDILVFKFLELT